MRVIIVIGLLIAAAFMFVLFLAELGQELSRQSYQAPPDFDEGDDWDAMANEDLDAVPAVASGSRIPRTAADTLRRRCNALDDLRSAL